MLRDSFDSLDFLLLVLWLLVSRLLVRKFNGDLGREIIYGVAPTVPIKFYNYIVVLDNRRARCSNVIKCGEEEVQYTQQGKGNDLIATGHFEGGLLAKDQLSGD